MAIKNRFSWNIIIQILAVCVSMPRNKDFTLDHVTRLCQVTENKILFQLKTAWFYLMHVTLRQITVYNLLYCIKMAWLNDIKYQ